MRYRKRKKKKDEQDPIVPFESYVPPSNGAGQTPNHAGNAALVRQYAFLELTAEERDVFIHLEQGYGIQEIALDQRVTIEVVKKWKQRISEVFERVQRDLNIML